MLIENFTQLLAFPLRCSNICEHYVGHCGFLWDKQIGKETSLSPSGTPVHPPVLKTNCHAFQLLVLLYLIIAI